MDIVINESLTWKDATAIYAAVVATAVALMNFQKYRRDIKNKLAVKFFIQSRAYNYTTHIGEWFQMFAIEVVNHSIATKYITQPAFQVDNKSGLFTAIKIVEPVTYPVKLESGQVWTLALDFDPIMQTLKEAKSKKVRVIITDTLGKSFKSKWIKVNDMQYNKAQHSV